MVAEAMGIYLTPYTPKTESGVGRTGTEVGRRDCGFLGTVELDGIRGRDWVRWKNTV